MIIILLYWASAHLLLVSFSVTFFTCWNFTSNPHSTMHTTNPYIHTGLEKCVIWREFILNRANLIASWRECYSTPSFSQTWENRQDICTLFLSHIEHYILLFQLHPTWTTYDWQHTTKFEMLAFHTLPIWHRQFQKSSGITRKNKRREALTRNSRSKDSYSMENL